MAATKQAASGEDWRKRRARWVELHRQRAEIELEISILAAEMDFDAKLAAAGVPATKRIVSKDSSEQLDEKQAAAYCKVHKSTIARWRKKGAKSPDGTFEVKLPCRMAGRSPRYTRGQLDRWMAGMRRNNLE